MYINSISGLGAVDIVTLTNQAAAGLQEKYIMLGKIPERILPDVVAGLFKVVPNTAYTSKEVGDMFLYYFKQKGNSASSITSSMLTAVRTMYGNLKTESTGTNTGTKPPAGTTPPPVTGATKCKDGTYVLMPNVCPENQPEPETGVVKCADGIYRVPSRCPENQAKPESDNTLIYVGIAALLLFFIMS